MDNKARFGKAVFSQNNIIPVLYRSTCLNFTNYWYSLIPQSTLNLTYNLTTYLVSVLCELCTIFDSVNSSIRIKRNLLRTQPRLSGTLKGSYVRARAPKQVFRAKVRSSRRSLTSFKVSSTPNYGGGGLGFYRYSRSLLCGRWQFVGVPAFAFLRHRPKPEYVTRLRGVTGSLRGWKWKKRKTRHPLIGRLLILTALRGGASSRNIFNSTRVRVKTRLNRRSFGINRISEEVALHSLSNKYLRAQSRVSAAVTPHLYWRGSFLTNFIGFLNSRRLQVKRANRRQRVKIRRLSTEPFLQFKAPKSFWLYSVERGSLRKFRRRQKPSIMGYRRRAVALYPIKGRAKPATIAPVSQTLIVKFLISKRSFRATHGRRFKIRRRRKSLASLTSDKKPLIIATSWSALTRFKSYSAHDSVTDVSAGGSYVCELRSFLSKSYSTFLLTDQSSSKIGSLTPLTPWSAVRFRARRAYRRKNTTRLSLSRAYRRQRDLGGRKFRMRRPIRRLPRTKHNAALKRSLHPLPLIGTPSRKFKFKLRRSGSRSAPHTKSPLLTKLIRRKTYLRFGSSHELTSLRSYKSSFSVSRFWMLPSSSRDSAALTLIPAARGGSTLLHRYKFITSRYLLKRGVLLGTWLTFHALATTTSNLFTRHISTMRTRRNPTRLIRDITGAAMRELSINVLSTSTATPKRVFKKSIRVRPALTASRLNKFTLSIGGFVLTTPSKRLNASWRRTRYDTHKKNHSFLDANRYKKDLLRQYLNLNARTLFTEHRRVRNWAPSRLFAKVYTSTLSTNPELSPLSALPWYNLRRAKRLIRPSRVRLRPGYIRIWKRARHSFRIIARLKYRYEHRLTRYFAKRAYHVQVAAKRYRSRWALHLPEYAKSLFIVLVRCKFVIDFHLSFLLLESKSVYLNANLVDNRYLTLLVGDFLQLIVSTKFYVMFRFQQNRLITRRFRILKFARIKFKPKTRRAERDVNYSYPNWVMGYKYNNSDVPTYTEVDFFSLSAYLIPEPLTLASGFEYYHEDTQLNPFNMYNWKYTC